MTSLTRFSVKPLSTMTRQLAAVASGRADPDLVVKGVRVLSTYSERILPDREIWLSGGRIDLQAAKRPGLDFELCSIDVRLADIERRRIRERDGADDHRRRVDEHDVIVLVVEGCRVDAHVVVQEVALEAELTRLREQGAARAGELAQARAEIARVTADADRLRTDLEQLKRIDIDMERRRK